MRRTEWHHEAYILNNISSVRLEIDLHTTQRCGDYMLNVVMRLTDYMLNVVMRLTNYILNVIKRLTI